MSWMFLIWLPISIKSNLTYESVINLLLNTEQIVNTNYLHFEGQLAPFVTIVSQVFQATLVYGCFLVAWAEGTSYSDREL